MQTVLQHQESGRWTSAYKKLEIKKIEKYTYFRGKFRAQWNIHDQPFFAKTVNG